MTRRSSSVDLRIDRLVLEGLDLGPEGQGLVREALESALSSRLAAGPTRFGVQHRRHNVAPVDWTPGDSPAELGSRIAAVVHREVSS